MRDNVVEPPEPWARPFVERIESILRSTGYRGVDTPFTYVFSSIAAGHLTGFDYFYEYAVDAYYEARDRYEEAAPLSEPRWAPGFWGLEEEAEALAEFEERLADSSTVLCAEPILAAAVLGAGLEKPSIAGGWLRGGYTGRPGGYMVLARRPRGKRCRILVPGSLYSLALAGLSAAGLEPGAARRLVVPDPAIIRKRVFDERPAYAELSSYLEKLLADASRRAMRASEEEACREQGIMLVEYRFTGLLEAFFSYIC